MPAMRASLRWALTLLLAALALAVAPASPALASSPTLDASPSSAQVGAHVHLNYHENMGATCSSGDQVWFRVDSQQTQPFAKSDPQQDCSATAGFTVPSQWSCGSAHTFYADMYWAANGPSEDTSTFAQTSFTVTCPKPSATPSPTPTKTSVLPLPTILPTHSPTASPTPSPTASPTLSPTASPTPSATPTATPTPTAIPTATGSAAPVTAVEPPDFPTPGGSSGTPWIVGGVVLGVAGVAGSLVFIRPKAGTPIVAGISIVSVVVGGGLALLGPADQPKPVITGSYTVGDHEGCGKGDIPVNGGFYDLGTPTNVMRFRPAGSSSDTGYWETSAGAVSQGSTVCLRVGRPLVWRVRDNEMPADKASGGVSCQTPESLLSGGFAFPWGLNGLSSYPQAPMRWSASNASYTDGPAPDAIVSALCAELPDGLRTYVATSSTAGAGVTTAHCFSGDAVLNGGYAGSHVEGSYPVDAGWAAKLGEGGGAAYAICFHPSRTFGLRSTSTHSGTGDASCDATESVLAGGWSTGTDLDGLQHFEPSGDGWKSELNGPAGGTAYVLCARHY
jgi:hypothetical protein